MTTTRLMCVTALCAAMACRAAEPAGYVLEVQGRWLQKGEAAPLTVGAPLPTGALILAPAPAAGDRITVVAARTGSVLAARRCDAVAACRRPLAIPEAPAAPMNGFLHRVFAALADQPDRYVSTLSRGATSLHDQVLVWEAGRLDVGPMLASRAEAVYETTLTRIGCASWSQCGDAPTKTNVVWSPRAPVASIELARPGLFELSLRRAGESAALPAERSWVLAVVHADEAAAREQLRAATALTESWGAAVDPDAKRGFIRAAMSIADR